MKWLIPFLLLFASEANAQSLPPFHCMDEEMEKRVRGIMSAAIDNALREYTEHLFETWVRDTNEQPKRASTGIRIAVGAYVRARSSLDNWHPPRCPDQNR
jgi:hypothetical protein